MQGQHRPLWRRTAPVDDEIGSGGPRIAFARLALPTAHMGDLVRYPRVLAVAAVASVAGVCLPTGPVTAAPVVSAGQTASAGAAARQLAASDRSLREASDRPVCITRDPDGRARAVVADPTHPLQRASTVGNATTPADAAKAFLAEHADALGLASNAQGLNAPHRQGHGQITQAGQPHTTLLDATGLPRDTNHLTRRSSGARRPLHRCVRKGARGSRITQWTMRRNAL
jgi:hypothetical protein